MSLRMAKPEHEVAYQDLAALMSKHADKVSALELLAIGANMVGKLIALQDQRSMSPGLAMEIVAQNIEAGNAQVLAQVQATKGTA
jgi:hypothetical protein